jgi:hypothetical protein
MKTHRLQVVSSIEQGKGGGAFAAVMMALAIAACTRTQSLGAAGTPDGGDAQASSDAVDAPLEAASDSAPDLIADAAPDVVPDAEVPDVPGDAHVDQTMTDVPPLITCTDNGVTYQVGAVVPRAGCQLSCICLPTGFLGFCTGIPCQTDGSVVIDPVEVALIVQSASTISPEIDVRVDARGSAERTILGGAGSATPAPRSFPPGSPEVTLFLYDLLSVQNAGDLGQVGDPGAIFEESCAKSVSLGTRTTVTSSESATVTSGDLQCLLNPTAAQVALARDAEVLLGTADSTFTANLLSCMQSGGQPSASLCCAGSTDFPNTCTVGACTCAPSSSASVNTCVCPTGACFQPSDGCVGPAGVCTTGADQTCNDNPAISSFHGRCATGGRCVCDPGFTLLASGKCS